MVHHCFFTTTCITIHHHPSLSITIHQPSPTQVRLLFRALAPAQGNSKLGMAVAPTPQHQTTSNTTPCTMHDNSSQRHEGAGKCRTSASQQPPAIPQSGCVQWDDEAHSIWHFKSCACSCTGHWPVPSDRHNLLLWGKKKTCSCLSAGQQVTR